MASFGKIRNVHMVGIGGIGMSSIAEVLLRRGFKVSGSDLELSDLTDRLQELGAVIHRGHNQDQIGDADVVVHSSAVNANENPETLAASRSRIPVIRRSEMLGELMRMKYGVGISGTHGKTTTTTMTGQIVAGAGLDPTVIVGGKVASFGSNAVNGEGDIIVIEADEFDRTFLRLTPVVAVINNIEEEHLDTYEDIEDIKRAFTKFANAVPFFGAAIINIDDPNVRDILADIDRRVVTFGLSRQADVRAVQIKYRGLQTEFTVSHKGKKLGEVKLRAPGEHNVLNALASIAVGLELDLPFESIIQSLAKYSGVQRRFQVKFNSGGISLIDDYAHHPTEIAATLRAASKNWPNHRLIAVFQPHIDGSMIAKLTTEYGHSQVHYVQLKNDIPRYLANMAKPGDMIIVMGAGDIWRICEPTSEFLKSITKEKDG